MQGKWCWRKGLWRRWKLHRSSRPPLFPPRRGRHPSRRRHQSTTKTRMDPKNKFQRAGSRNDARRPENRQPGWTGKKTRLQHLQLSRIKESAELGKGWVGSKTDSSSAVSSCQCLWAEQKKEKNQPKPNIVIPNSREGSISSPFSPQLFTAPCPLQN